jgi:hypothetical protein
VSEHDRLYAKLKVLNERLWDQRAPRPVIDDWLENFAEDSESSPSERLHALFLLSQFVYFSDLAVRELLRSLFRDHFRYPIVAELRRTNGDTTDGAFLREAFAAELRATRFLGIGNPAESGTHLLYYFRQENGLSKDQFVAVPELFDRSLADPNVQLANPDIQRLVFIDDFCGSGSQAVIYSRNILRVLRDIAARSGQPLHMSYLVLAGRADGLQTVRASTDFDAVEAVFELDSSYRSLSPGSRHFENVPPGVTREDARDIALHYGKTLWAAHPLGYKDGELLIGFHHNIPDNTLPIIWFDEPSPPWKPVFPRYHKVYGNV